MEMTPDQARGYVQKLQFQGDWCKHLTITPTLLPSAIVPDSYKIQVWVNGRMSSPQYLHLNSLTPERLAETVLVCCQQIFTVLLYEALAVRDM